MMKMKVMMIKVKVNDNDEDCNEESDGQAHTQVAGLETTKPGKILIIKLNHTLESLNCDVIIRWFPQITNFSVHKISSFISI